MARAGDWYENVKTKELARLVVSPEETGGTRLEAELFLQPGGAVVGEHLHDAFGVALHPEPVFVGHAWSP